VIYLDVATCREKGSTTTGGVYACVSAVAVGPELVTGGCCLPM